MKVEKIEQGCKTCKYFAQHYRKDNVTFSRVCCGHCMNYKVKHDRRKSLPYLNGCDKWEAAEEDNHEETMRLIYKEVKSLNKRLEDLTAVLVEELEVK